MAATKRKKKASYRKYKKLVAATIGLAVLWGQAHGFEMPQSFTPAQITEIIMGAGTLFGIWAMRNG